VVNALGGFAKVGGLGPEDVGHERLRIAVVQREPSGLDWTIMRWPGKKTWFAVGSAKR